MKMELHIIWIMVQNVRSLWQKNIRPIEKWDIDCHKSIGVRWQITNESGVLQI